MSTKKRSLLFFSTLVSIIISFNACDPDNPQTGGGNQLKKMTWTQLAEEYPFFNDFPVYDGDVENHVYDNQPSFKSESIVFMDYKCESSVAEAYKAKLTTAGFIDESGYGIYKKSTDIKEITASVTYATGSTAINLNTVTK